MMSAPSSHFRQAVLCDFLMAELRHDRWEFSKELCRVGLKFIRDNVEEGDDEIRFTEAFDELVAMGCRPRVLASTVYCYHKSRLWVPHFPGNKEMEARRARLEGAVSDITRLQNCRIFAGTLQQSRPDFCEQQLQQVAELLQLYSASLKDWWAPRKDIIRSYGPIPCCAYAKIATGKFQFPLVSALLECFGYRPAPQRQRQKPARSGYEPTDQSLERNFRNFTTSWPQFCECLKNGLIEADDADRPKEVLDRMLEPNDFAWKVALAPPRR